MHAAPGSITAALLERRPGAPYVVRQTLCEPAPTGPIELLAALTAFLGRRDVAGRAAFVALPDADGSVTAVTLTGDEKFLQGDELVHALHERTPFETDEGRIVHGPNPLDTGPTVNSLLVGSTPNGTLSRQRAALAVLPPGYHGLGLAGIALLRGAHSLGLLDDASFVVDVEPDQTLLTAVHGTDVRRYAIAAGANTFGTARAGALLEDIDRVLGYDAEQVRQTTAETGVNPDAGEAGDTVVTAKREAHDGPSSEGDAPAVAEGGHQESAGGPGAASDEDESAAELRHVNVLPAGPRAAEARKALREHLGDRLASPAVSAAIVVGQGGRPLSVDDATRFAGAIGAALCGFDPPGQAVVIDPAPDDVPDYVAPGSERTGGLLRLAAGVLLLLAVLGGWWWWQSRVAGHGADRPDEPDKPAVVTPPVAVVSRDPAVAQALVLEAAHRHAFADAVTAGTELASALPGEVVELVRLVRGPRGYDVDVEAVGDHAALERAHAALIEAGGARSPPLEVRVVRNAAGGLTASARVEFPELPPDAADGAPSEVAVPALADTREALGAVGTVLDKDGVLGLVLAPERAVPTLAALLDSPAPRSMALARLGDRIVARVEPEEPAGALAGRRGSLKSAALAPAEAGFVLEASEAVESAARALPDRPLLAARARESAGGPAPVPRAAPRLDRRCVVTVSVPSPAADGATLALEVRGPGQGEFAAVPTSSAPSVGTTLSVTIPGPPGSWAFRWRRSDGVVGGETAVAVDAPVDVRCASVDPGAGTAEFELTLPLASPLSARASVGIGEAVRARAGAETSSPSGLVLDAGLRLRSIDTVERTETHAVAVPEFAPDGSVRRDDAGAAVTRLEEVEGPAVVHVLTLTAQDGSEHVLERRAD